MKKFLSPLTLIAWALREILFLGVGLLAQPCPAASDFFEATGSLATPRDSHTATLLADDKVLVAGGLNPTNGSLAGVELYDPASGSWSVTGSLGTPRDFHRATLLSNGE